MGWSKTEPTLPAGSEWTQVGTTKYQDNNTTILSTVYCARLEGKGFALKVAESRSHARYDITMLYLRCDINGVTGTPEDTIKGTSGDGSTTVYFIGEADAGVSVNVKVRGNNTSNSDTYGGNMSFIMPDVLAQSAIWINISGVWKKFGYSEPSVIVTIHSTYGSIVSWTGTETGSITVPTTATQVDVSLKQGTYTFVATLELDSETVTIHTTTVSIGDITSVNMYPDGAVYWYGMPVASDIVAGAFGTFTREQNCVVSTYTRAQSWSKAIMTKTENAIDTTGRTTFHVIYKDVDSSINVMSDRFGVQEETPDQYTASSQVYVTGSSRTRAELSKELGTLAGKSLYFCSMWNAFDTFSGGARMHHKIYAVWFE